MYLVVDSFSEIDHPYPNAGAHEQVEIKGLLLLQIGFDYEEMLVRSFSPTIDIIVKENMFIKEKNQIQIL